MRSRQLEESVETKNLGRNFSYKTWVDPNRLNSLQTVTLYSLTNYGKVEVVCGIYCEIFSDSELNAFISGELPIVWTDLAVAWGLLADTSFLLSRFLRCDVKIKLEYVL